MMTMTIERLCIYPIKSLPGIDVEVMHFDALGAVHDRRYMLVDEKGVFVSQRTFAQLCLMHLSATEGGWLLQNPDSGTEKFLAYNGSQEHILSVQLWSDTVIAYDQGDEWAAFFSEFLQHSVRLVYLPVDSLRPIDPDYCSDAHRHVGFADGFPLLLTSTASLAALNRQLTAPIDVARFRPNIHVSGAEAFAERHWQALRDDASAALFSVVKPCSRCVIPTINPATAKKEAEVWKVLKSLCAEEDGNIYFGQNIIHHHYHALQLGQPLDVEA